MPQKSAFAQVVEIALKKYGDVEWLGNNSPMSAIYFLGERVDNYRANTKERGQILQKLLKDAKARIRGKNADRYQKIIEVYYFEGRSLTVAQNTMGLGKNAFNVSRNDAIAQLTNEIIDLVEPALRLESFPLASKLIGRQLQRAQCNLAISQKNTLLITGGPGLGKTALGISIADGLKAPTFWFTFREGFNDSLDSLLFAVAKFLFQQGQGALWAELHSRSLKNDPEILLQLFRYSIEKLSPESLPVFIFDDVEHLRPAVNKAHHAICSFLNSLHLEVPIIYISQQTSLVVDTVVVVDELDEAGCNELLRHQMNLNLGAQDVHRLFEHTRGNPRLLELCAALVMSGESLNQVIQERVIFPSMNALLDQLYRRLTKTEIAALAQLSVLRNPAPIENWLPARLRQAVAKLETRRLVVLDSARGIKIVPAYRASIYRNLTESARRELHLNAAKLRASLGAFTTSIYHLIRADRIGQAVNLWQEHKKHEIAQGQGLVALSIWIAVERSGLRPELEDSITLVISELKRYAGNLIEASEHLEHDEWSMPLYRLQAYELKGMIANDLPDFANAKASFQDALEIGQQIVETRNATVRKGLSWMHMQNYELELAGQEADLAHYEVEHLRGNIELYRCDYTAAEKHFASALAVAEAYDFVEGITKTENSLSQIYMLQGQFHLAKEYQHQVVENYRSINKNLAVVGSMVTLAVLHNLAGEFEKAYEIVAKADLELEGLGVTNPGLKMYILAAMSESYLGMEKLEQAVECARIVAESSSLRLMPDACRILGEALSRQGKFQEAERSILKAVRQAHRQKDLYILGYSWRTLGLCFLKQAKYEFAQRSLQNAVQQFSDIALLHEVEKTNAIIPDV